MLIEIPADYGTVVQNLISDGGYRDEGEVIVAGLRLLQARETIRQQVQTGIDQLDAGESVDAAEVYERARQRIAEIAKEQNAEN